MTDEDKRNSTPDEPSARETPAEEAARQDEPEARRGQVRFQDADTAQPRKPSVGEQRARRRAVEQQRAAELAEREEAERKAKTRRRVLIGGGVTVGVVAMVAVWYAAATPDEVTAHCVSDDDVLATDENVCDENYVRSQGGYHSGGFFFIPIPGGGYRQYHYNYGGSVGSGGRVTGGTLSAPSNATVKTGTGKTIQRGGLGVSGGGKSGGS